MAFATFEVSEIPCSTPLSDTDLGRLEDVPGSLRSTLSGVLCLGQSTNLRHSFYVGGHHERIQREVMTALRQVFAKAWSGSTSAQQLSDCRRGDTRSEHRTRERVQSCNSFVSYKPIWEIKARNEPKLELSRSKGLTGIIQSIHLCTFIPRFTPSGGYSLSYDEVWSKCLILEIIQESSTLPYRIQHLWRNSEGLFGVNRGR